MKKFVLLIMMLCMCGCSGKRESLIHTTVLDLVREHNISDAHPEESGDENIDNSDVSSHLPSDRVPTSPVLPNTELSDKIEDTKEEPHNPIESQLTTLLTVEEIKEYNKKVKAKTTALYDLGNIDISSDRIKALIESYKMPTLPKYDGDREVQESEIEAILDNRALGEIDSQTTVKRGIIANRANLKSMPTEIHFYNSKGIQNFDQLQQTELSVNTPVLILHSSQDKKWNFVLSPIYAGWVKASDIGECTLNDWSHFIETTSFIVVTVHSIAVDNRQLDMGVKLPLVKEETSSYTVSIPSLDDSGRITSKYISIPKVSANKGYLAYTKENVLALTQKYLGTPYSWGGMDNGLDCSSLIMNIYRTFGFEFPRDTSTQQNSIGTVISLANKTITEKLATLEALTDPAVLYQPGHAMIYLGKDSGKNVIIHASGSDLKVVKTVLTSASPYLAKIDRIVTIP